MSDYAFRTTVGSRLLVHDECFVIWGAAMNPARRFSARNRQAFLSALDRIEGANRQPTVWEAACLFGALGAMANGNEELAARKIEMSAFEVSGLRSWNLPPSLTIVGLRRTLEELSSLNRRSDQSPLQRDRYRGT